MFSGGCYVQEIPTGKIIGHGTKIGGLYNVDDVAQHGSAMLTYTSDAQKLQMWHKRLGHPSLGYLKRLFPSISFKNFSLDCESCVLAKSHRHTYTSSSSYSDKPFMLIHSDVWALMSNSTIHEYSYFVLFIDDCTRMSWVYFLKRKSEVFNVFVKFYKMIQAQFNKQIHILRPNNRGEYMKIDMKEFITSNGLIH